MDGSKTVSPSNELALAGLDIRSAQDRILPRVARPFYVGIFALELGLFAVLASGSPERLEFSNHGCYGPCPVYDATIYADGRVHYRGLDHVHTYGDRWHQISPGRARRLIRRAARFEGEPPTLGATDQIETTTVAHHEGRTVTVDNDHGWRRTATARRASRLERRVRLAVRARRLAHGPVGCRDRSFAAQFDVRFGDGADERALLARFAAWLTEHPQTKVELWTSAPKRDRADARASLVAIELALAASGVDRDRVAWSKAIVAEDANDDAAHTVFARAAPARCVVSPP